MTDWFLSHTQLTHHSSSLNTQLLLSLVHVSVSESSVRLKRSVLFDVSDGVWVVHSDIVRTRILQEDIHGRMWYTLSSFDVFSIYWMTLLVDTQESRNTSRFTHVYWPEISDLCKALLWRASSWVTPTSLSRWRYKKMAHQLLIFSQRNRIAFCSH
jgi:hypothetical protein